MYITRKLENKLLEYLKYFPVVAVTGPRQSGKSTMLKNLLGSEYQYVTFDDFQVRELFYEDPNPTFAEIWIMGIVYIRRFYLPAKVRARRQIFFPKV